jgi:serine/threonine protein kinase/tetratricopeptide (TPR) repeat protein
MLRDPVADWRELSALYEQAEMLEGRELQAWLDGLKAESKHLLGDLKRMLGARARIAEEGFLETLPTLPHSVERLPAEWGEGSRLGPYRLVRHIGSGGMAEVWLADRADGAFDRRVAMKLLYNHPTRAQRETFVERFRRERDILASLNHPNIAGLHDAGVAPNGQPWLALEVVQGERITDWCDARRLDVRGRVRLFMQVLDAVAYAHANLVVHRDLKPANVLVTDKGEVKLLDFGIAKLLDAVEAGAKDSDLTRQGGRPLTPQYASPEQLQGQPLTTVSDVYSAGVLFYELLCGSRPFDLHEGATPAQIEAAIVNDDPRPPSRRSAAAAVAEARGTSAKALVKTLAGDLDAIAGKALEKTPAKRYRSAEAFRDDLVRWCDGRSVEATNPTAGDRLWKFYRRHSLAVGTGSVVLLVGAALSVATVVNGVRARSESARATASRLFVVELFKLADPQSSRGLQLSPSELLRSGARKALDTLGHQPDVQTDVLRDIGRMQNYAGEIVDADVNLRRVVQLLAEQGRQRDWLHAQADLADNAFHLGDVDRVASILKAIEVPVRAAADDPALQARFWYLSGNVARSRQQLAEAIEQLSLALALYTKANGAGEMETVDVMRELGEAHSQAGQDAVALQLLSDALGRVQASTAAGPRDRLAIEAHLSLALVRAGRYEGMVVRLRELLSRCDRDLGPAADQCAFFLALSADVALRTEDRAEQDRLLSRLQVAARNTSSPWRQSGSANAAAQVLARQHRLNTHPELRAQLEQIHGSTQLPTRDRTQALFPLAIDAVLRGDGAEAEKRAQQALTFQLAQSNPERALVARAISLRGVARAIQGQYVAGLADVRSARAELEALYGKGHTLVQIYRCNEAVILFGLGEHELARTVLRDALSRLGTHVGDSPLLSRLQKLSTLFEVNATSSAAHPGADAFHL